MNWCRIDNIVTNDWYSIVLIEVMSRKYGKVIYKM